MKHIVLVEDDAPIRDVFKMVFAGGDYKVIPLEDGESIINNEIDPPDLFVLDKQLSGMNGLDLCRFIRNSEKFKNVPVIMLSANPDIVKLAKEAGADNAVAKPFSIKKLRETISYYTTK